MASKSPLNFLPEDYLEKRRQQRTNVICLSLFGVVMAGLIAAFLLDERRQALAAQARETINGRMDSAGEQLAQIEEMQARKEKMIRKADVTAALLERRPRHFLLAYLTNALPKGASLVSLELATSEVRAPNVPADKKSADGQPPPPSRASRAGQLPGGTNKPDESSSLLETIRVVGLAPSDKVVSRFIAALDSSSLFRRVDLERSEEHTYQQQLVRRFILKIELDEQAEVTDDMVQSQQVKPEAFDGN